MGRNTPQVPLGYYEALGRLVAISSLAETELALCGWAAETGYVSTEKWVFDRLPGGATKYAKARAKCLDADQESELRQLLASYRRLVEVRHQAVHGVITLDPTLAANEQWLVQSARHGVASLADLLEAMEGAVARLHSLVKSADALRHAIAARPSAAQRRRDTPFPLAEAKLEEMLLKPRPTQQVASPAVDCSPAPTSKTDLPDLASDVAPER